jgi:type II secretory ATPase GspE/PulE/Tfp pilus assembly ATPase PilB-like protein
MGILDQLSRPDRQRAASLIEHDAVCGYAGPVIPEPSAELQKELVYPARVARAFDRVAVDLGMLSAADAQSLREQASRDLRRIDDIAIEREILTSEDVQLVVEEQACVVYVNAPYAAGPLFLSWVGDLCRQGVIPTIRRVSAREISQLKEGQVTESGPDDVDLETLSQARQILLDCAAIGASDLHVLVREKHAELQVRVKGELKTAANFANVSLHAHEGERLNRAICQGLATVKPPTYNPLDFQDAQIAGDVLPRSDLTSVRVIRGPAWPVEAGGGFMVDRLQYHGIRKHFDKMRAAAATQRLGLRTPDKPAGEFRLGKMGFTPAQLLMIVRLMRRPQGIVFVTGPTGSGKTTTLYEIALELGRMYPGERLVTIENPPEYPIDHAIQLTAESERFPEMLRMALRMDPDTILPSEIRGVDEAIAALQAAMTGHRVLTTLHVDEPFETFPRLQLLDHVRLAPRLICNHKRITGLIAQRRVPLLCPDCRRPFSDVAGSMPAYAMNALETWGDVKQMCARGERDDCETCAGSGIVEEQAVAEVVVTDATLMHDCIELGSIEAARRYRARPDADKTMIEHAMDLVLAGKLDPRDAEKVDEIPVKGTAL